MNSMSCLMMALARRDCRGISSCTTGKRPQTGWRDEDSNIAVEMISRQKKLGQFFTPDAVASALVNWAARKPQDRLLDPACGDGQFLACHRRAVGIELDPEHAAEARQR